MNPVPASRLSTETAMSERSKSLAHRLLSGAGRATVVAYRPEPARTMEVFAHALLDSGRLVVATSVLADDTLAGLTEGERIEVRLDVVKESPEVSVHLVTATGHLLGEFWWATPAESAALIHERGLPGELIAIATAPGGRLGLIDTDRVYVHDSAGISSFAPNELASAAPAFPAAWLEGDAYAVIAALSRGERLAICDAVTTGLLDGEAMFDAHEQAGCRHTWGEVWCADIDATGITLHETTGEASRTVVAAFARPVRTLAELDAEVTRLLAAATAPVAASIGEA